MMLIPIWSILNHIFTADAGINELMKSKAMVMWV